jgi:ribosomal protein L16 Arg81 hydroxylase
MSQHSFDFARLIHPITPEEFFQEYWEQKPLLVCRKEPTYYHELFRMDDVDAVLHYCRPKPPDILVVQNQDRLVADTYITDQGTVNLHQLYKAYDEGYTIIINALERFWPPLARCCHGLKETLNHHVAANMYLAPRQAVSLKPHYDTHDVLALQVDGSKQWYVYDSPQTLPFMGSFRPIFAENALPPLLHEVQLQAGDLLYLPRGFVHRAATTETCSLHVTIGLHTFQWHDLVSQALTAVSLKDPRFRKALPVGFMDHPELLSTLQEQLRTLAAWFAQCASAEEGVALLTERFVAEMVPVPDGHFRQVEDRTVIAADTWLAKRPGMKCRVLGQGLRGSIQFPGNTISGPYHILPTLQFIARTDTAFAVRELPGDYSQEGKVTLVRRLVRGGLLRVVQEGGG